MHFQSKEVSVKTNRGIGRDVVQKWAVVVFLHFLFIEVTTEPES